MVRLRLLRVSLTTLAIFGARPALAGPINFTGLVENDFKPAPGTNVRVVPVADTAGAIGQSAFIAQSGWVSGWSVKDVRTSYDPKSDTLYVGFNTFPNAQGRPAIIGDVDGNGDPGVAAPGTIAAGGVDLPNLGGRESVAFAIAPDRTDGQPGPGTPVLVAGVPADKTSLGPGLIGFNVAAYKGLNLGLGYNFGPTLPGHLGKLAFNPSADHPGFEFTITNLSTVPGIDPFKGFWVSSYAGSPDDVVAGETGSRFVRLRAFEPQEIPEPATLVAWAAAAAALAAARHLRRAAGSE